MCVKERWTIKIWKKKKSGCKIRNSKGWTVLWHHKFTISKKEFSCSFWVNMYMSMYLHTHINLATVEKHLSEWSCFQLPFFSPFIAGAGICFMNRMVSVAWLNQFYPTLQYWIMLQRFLQNICVMLNKAIKIKLFFSNRCSQIECLNTYFGASWYNLKSQLQLNPVGCPLSACKILTSQALDAPNNRQILKEFM